MTWLVERLVELRKHLDHLKEIHVGAVRSLGHDARFPENLVAELSAVVVTATQGRPHVAEAIQYRSLDREELQA